MAFKALKQRRGGSRVHSWRPAGSPARFQHRCRWRRSDPESAMVRKFPHRRRTGVMAISVDHRSTLGAWQMAAGYRSGNPSLLPDSARAPDRWRCSPPPDCGLIVIQPLETLMHPARDLHVGKTGKLGQGLIVGDRHPRHDFSINRSRRSDPESAVSTSKKNLHGWRRHRSCA